MTRRWSASPRWRIVRGTTIALGPGKADLLDAIRESGSISGAARSLGMSYRRAWLLVKTMNASFRQPLVTTAPFRGKGASLTADGKQVLRLYRDVEKRSLDAARASVAKLVRLMKA
jgi:molybdate transport system regulatory protein